MDFDLNQASFQADLIGLEKPELLAFFKTLRKLRQMSWAQVYRDSGLNWESIKSIEADAYTIRITQKCRAVVMRDNDVLRFISIYPDHNSAYKR